MALHLYRRHRRDCKAGRPYDSRSGEFDERRKGGKQCGCFLYVSGTLGGIFDRRTTHKTTWDDGHAYVAALKAAQTWDGDRPGPALLAPPVGAAADAPALTQPAADADAPAPSDPPPAPTRSRIAIAKAIAAFLATKLATVGPSTYRKHQTATKQLRAFADSEGYVMLDQFRPEDLDRCPLLAAAVN